MKGAEGEIYLDSRKVDNLLYGGVKSPNKGARYGQETKGGEGIDAP
jgi:hypothetical protein